MKKIFLLLFIMFLLSGCTAKAVLPQETAAPERTEPTVLTEIPETEAQTEPTEPTAAAQPQIPETEPPSQPEGPSQPVRLPVDLYGKPGEFMSVEPVTGEPVPDSEGKCYGFRDDYWWGCSVWCAVTTREEAVGASSFLEPIGDFTYEPENLSDGNRDTVWSEGVDGYGIGEYIELMRRYNWEESPSSRQFDYRTICIVNGYAQNETKWRNNSRVQTMAVYVNGILLMRLHLLDTMKPQYFDISPLGLSAPAGERIKFRFVIEDVYPGEKYEDTCVTGIEIEFWTPNH